MAHAANKKASRFIKVRSRWVVFVLFVPFLFFIYDLLLGPIFSLSTSRTIPHSTFRAFYYPISFIEERIPLFYRFNDWYFSFWDGGYKTSLNEVQKRFSEMDQLHNPQQGSGTNQQAK